MHKTGTVLVAFILLSPPPPNSMYFVVHYWVLQSNQIDKMSFVRLRSIISI